VERSWEERWTERAFVLAIAVAALAGLLAAAGTAGAATADPTEAPLLVPDQGPETPPGDLAAQEEAPWHVAVRNPVDTELKVFTAGVRTTTMEVPDEGFDRVYLEYTSWPNHPNGDPWDRTFSVAVDGAEVVHGTTTRGNFTIYEDLTEKRGLFEPGSTVEVAWYLDSWADEGIVTDVRFHFLEDPGEAQAVQAGAGSAAEAVAPGVFFDRIDGAGDAATGTLELPDEAPEDAVLEVFLSGHGGDGEFWYLNAFQEPTPPTFRVLVDGETVGYVEALPYTYALLGFEGGSVAEAINQYAWWTAHKGLDRAGVHTGVGEVPAYRGHVAAEDLDLLTGEPTVTLEQLDHGGTWYGSVNVLLEPSPAGAAR